MNTTSRVSLGSPRQHGMTLIMALIMLVVLTLLALTSFNLGKSNLQIVSNVQHRDEAAAAAREVIEETISSTRFFDTRDAMLSKPCDGDNNATCIDTNGDGRADVKVKVPTPTCAKVAPVKLDQLKLSNADDANCSLSESQTFGMAGSANGDSLCANTVWDVHAVATDIDNQSTGEVVQGIAVRVPSDDSSTACPAN